MFIIVVAVYNYCYCKNAFMSMYVFNVKCEQHALRSVHQVSILSKYIMQVYSQPSNQSSNPSLYNFQEKNLQQLVNKLHVVMLTCNSIFRTHFVKLRYMNTNLYRMLTATLTASQHCRLEQPRTMSTTAK